MSNVESTLRPRDEADLAEIVRAHPNALEPIGSGSKRTIGRPVRADVLDLSALSGVIDYRPEELVLTARAATALPDLQRTLAERNQRLAFEPPDLSTLLGVRAPATLGGVLCANLAGSRRVAAGAARDHFLGFRAISGRGERFKAGGKVVKNVTGYDLPKLMAGSWGTLAVLTEVTVRAVPASECEVSLLVPASGPGEAVRLLTAALGSPFEVSAGAFDPSGGVAVRLEGFGPSVQARIKGLLNTLSPPGWTQLDTEPSRQLWSQIAGAASLADLPVVWRLSVPPSEAPAIIRDLAPERYLLDWGGGLIWLGSSAADATRVRGAVRSGHATLIKAPESVRADVPVFHPLPAPLAALTARVKAAFDPENKLNPGRMG
jgi:glycolate oxidase FAD binding subunit